jgi:hypothetical protein
MEDRMSAYKVDVPAAFRTWSCGRCGHELITNRTCPCCPSELECLNCDARFDGETGAFVRTGGAS